MRPGTFVFLSLTGMAGLACRGPLSPENPGETPLLPYRDSLLDVSMRYPQGWIPSLKKSYSQSGTTYDLFFQAPEALATRRFSVKIVQPDLPSADRTLSDFKAEYLDRLVAASPDLRILDSGAATLGGEPAFRAEYLTYLSGKPYVRFLDYICLRPGRDVGLSFEAADSQAQSDRALYTGIAGAFRFYSP